MPVLLPSHGPRGTLVSLPGPRLRQPHLLRYATKCTWWGQPVLPSAHILSCLGQPHDSLRLPEQGFDVSKCTRDKGIRAVVEPMALSLAQQCACECRLLLSFCE
ncbi:hypothetical protein Mapa_004199 [Marchantia paleacea]|nr:hypothetical protein Mapa_004199 [Marchantia paleacea]